MSLADLRTWYHQRVCNEVLRTKPGAGGSGYLNLADESSRSSLAISQGIARRLGYIGAEGSLSGPEVADRFRHITKDYIKASFSLLGHLRPGHWEYRLSVSTSEFAQYAHLSFLDEAFRQSALLASCFGTDYIIKPDIVIARYAASDAEINAQGPVLGADERLASATYLRAANLGAEGQILHASISCKWTLRSDRSQNARTEGLNLIRNRKGHTPHIMVVTAEPLPTRIASLALGTGDVDCVYHFALYELEQTLAELDNQDQSEVLRTLTEGHRLRDISDLPLDLAI